MAKKMRGGFFLGSNTSGKFGLLVDPFEPQVLRTIRVRALLPVAAENSRGQYNDENTVF